METNQTNPQTTANLTAEQVLTACGKLAPLVFLDERPVVEQVNQEPNKLVFVPVEQSLLEQYQKLHEEVYEAFTCTRSPLDTAIELGQFWLSCTKKLIAYDSELAMASFKLIEFLNNLRSISKEADYFEEEASNAKAHLIKQAQKEVNRV